MQQHEKDERRSTALLATLRSGEDFGGSGASASALPALAWVVHCCVLSQGCWELMDCGAAAEEAVRQGENGSREEDATAGGDGGSDTRSRWNELPGRYLFRYIKDDAVAAEGVTKSPAVVLLLRMIEMGTGTITVTVLREGSEAPETCHFKTSEELDMTQRSWRARLLRIQTLVGTVDRALATCLASEPRAPSSSSAMANKEKQSAETTSTRAPRDHRPVEESREWQPPHFYPEPLPTPFIPGLPAGARYDPIFPGQLPPPRRPTGEPFPFPPRAPHRDLDPLGIMGGGGVGGPGIARRPRRGHPDTEMFRDPDEDDDFGLGGVRRPGYY